MDRIVVLGGGTGGTLVANRLERRLGTRAEIHVVDRDDAHLYQPGLLFVPFGLSLPEKLVRPRHLQLRKNVNFHESGIEGVDLEHQRVSLADGHQLGYDVLVVATGAQLQPEETEGLPDALATDRAFTFFNLPGATGLRDALAAFEGGRLVVNLVDMPIKCPVAPLEFSFLADWYFQRRGNRSEVDITYVTPLDGAFTKPVCSKQLGWLLDEKEIGLVTDFNAGEVDAERGVLAGYDGTEVPFDLLVTIPLHGGAEYVTRSDGLGDALGFVPTDLGTLQADAAPNVFALGDATDLPISKAGSVTHFEGEILADNVERFLKGHPLVSRYDGHANCFIETGYGKALLIDFNAETEPLPGRFPTAAGPLPLLRESRANHLGKRLFEWVYWHALLPGHDLPGIGATMPTRGKHPAAA